MSWLQEREHNREPRPIEWFIKTHEIKGKTFHEPVTTKFVVILGALLAITPIFF